MGNIWIHRKRGSRYEILSQKSRVVGWQAYDDGDPIVVYRAPGVGWRAGTVEPGRPLAQIAHVQCSGVLHPEKTVVIYRGIADGRIWVRPRNEFFDGRFYMETTR